MTNISKSIINILTSILVSLYSIKICSRFVLNFQDIIMPFFSNKMFRKFYSLEPYEQRDLKNKTTFTLMPRFKATFREMIESEEKGGHWFRAGQFKKWLIEYKINIDDIGIEINSHGFRGREINRDKAPDAMRILALGDSCTFGIIESMSYPNVIEHKLNESGLKVEVINAGVEKYGIRHILKRLDYFMEFKPDVATIYAGWIGANFFGDDFAGTLDILNNNYYFIQFKTLFYKHLRDSDCILPQKFDGKFYKKVTASYRSNYFIKQVELLIQKLIDEKVRVVLFTMPSLFDPFAVADADMLRYGNLPSFSKNAYIFGYRVYQYNRRLREISIRYNVPLIDLEKHIDLIYSDKKKHFWDACHLIPGSQIELGEFIAEELMRKGIVKTDGQ